MRHGARLVLVLGLWQCRGHAEPPRRRWDVSQAVFRVPSAAVIAFAQPGIRGSGIQSPEMRRFLDEWDRAADTLEKMGYRVGITFRDSLRFVVWPDSFDVVPERDGATWGYYFLDSGRRPYLVPGSLTSRQLLHALTRFHLAREGARGGRRPVRAAGA